MPKKSCAIVSDRPIRFQFKYREDSRGCRHLKKQLRKQIALLYIQGGVRRFYLGGSLGVDMWAGEILLELKERPEYSDIEIVEVLPYKRHDAEWDKHSQERMAFLKEHSTEVIFAAAREWKGAYAARARYMVDHADCLLAVYDNNRSVQSEITKTVLYAEARSMRDMISITLIHPDTNVVTQLSRRGKAQMESLQVQSP